MEYLQNRLRLAKNASIHERQKFVTIIRQILKIEIIVSEYSFSLLKRKEYRFGTTFKFLMQEFSLDTQMFLGRNVAGKKLLPVF